jgi:hypothetical protein
VYYYSKERLQEKESKTNLVLFNVNISPKMMPHSSEKVLSDKSLELGPYIVITPRTLGSANSRQTVECS